MKLGKTEKLKVVKKTDFGVYLGTEDDKVLLPKNEVPKGADIGTEIKVFICRDSKDRLIATIHEPVAQVDETAYIEVKEITKYGAFLDWGLGKDLFLPYKEQTTDIKAGDKVLVGIYTDKSNRLCATMKVYDFLKCNAPYKEEDIVKGVVYNYNPRYGAFVAVDYKYHGLIQSKELTLDVHVGMEVEARVKSVQPDGKLDLALRKKSYLQIEDDAHKILDYMEHNGGKIGYNDKAKPEIIKKDFGMSKSEFKRAIGRLLKERRIIIGENNIFLDK